MASWNDVFGTTDFNGAPYWMTRGSDSVASQVIRYPPRQQRTSYYDGYTVPVVVDPRVITMQLKDPICCEGCEERVLSRLIDIDGVQSVKCDQLKQKVTVSDTASHAEVFHACKTLFKRSKWWEY